MFALCYLVIRSWGSNLALAYSQNENCFAPNVSWSFRHWIFLASLFLSEKPKVQLLCAKMCALEQQKSPRRLSMLNLFLQCWSNANEACRFPDLFHSILLRENWYKRLVYPDVLIKSESNGSKTCVKMDKFLKRKCINDADQEEKPPENQMPKTDASKCTLPWCY